MRAVCILMLLVWVGFFLTELASLKTEEEQNSPLWKAGCLSTSTFEVQLQGLSNSLVSSTTSILDLATKDSYTLSAATFLLEELYFLLMTTPSLTISLSSMSFGMAIISTINFNLEKIVKGILILISCILFSLGFTEFTGILINFVIKENILFLVKILSTNLCFLTTLVYFIIWIILSIKVICRLFNSFNMGFVYLRRLFLNNETIGKWFSCIN